MKRPGLILFLWVLLLALCAWPFTVRAAGTVSGTTGPGWRAASGACPGDPLCNIYFTPVQADLDEGFCNAWYAYAGTNKPTDGDLVRISVGAQPTPSAWRCRYLNTPGNNATWVLSTTFNPKQSTGSTCPANSTNCICNAGYVPTGNPYGTACGTAASVCPSFVPTNPDYVYTTSVKPSPSEICDTAYSCSVAGTVSMPNADGSQWYVFGPFTSNLKDCTGTNSPGTAGAPTVSASAASAPATGCPSGQVPGTLNGGTVCYTPSSSVSSETTSVSAPAGSASAPTVTVSDGNGGSISVPPGGTVTKTTNCVGSSCTTTTTVKDGAGVTVGTATSGNTRGGFCQENPDTSICKEGTSSMSQACAAGLASQVCEGDAIQCAIAKEQFTRNCQLFEGTHETRTVAENALSGVPDPTHPGASGNVSTVAIDQMIDTAPIIGAGSCPSDVSYAIPILGAMVVPWSDMCSWLELMGTILVAAAGVTWLFIVFGSKGV